MDKAPDAFRTISEVADHLDTPAHVLRFWETRFPQVKPVKGAGGRRYYRPSDVALLAGIRRLLHNDGMTIRGVQKILRDQGVRHVAELGGEALEAPEPLVDLLPTPRAEAEVVPLRRIETAADPAIPDQHDSAVQEPRPAAMSPLEAAKAAPFVPAPQIPDFGGFAADLDVPRAGEGGFIAFSSPLTPSRPEALAPPSRPRRPPEPDRQPSLFDAPPSEGPQDISVIEEAPHVFVEDEAHLAEITRFPDPLPEDEPLEGALLPDEAPLPEEEPGGLLAGEGFAPLAGDAVEALLTPDPDLSAEEAIAAVLALAESTPAAPADSPAAEPVAEAAVEAAADQAALLATLAPRLRRMRAPKAETLLTLADLQARLGLLHAQMVEASTRPRRPAHESGDR